MTKEDKILEVLSEISGRIQSTETRLREALTIIVEQGEEIRAIRAHQVDSADRMGTQVHRHENTLIEVNARLYALDGKTPRVPRPARASNGSSRR